MKIKLVDESEYTISDISNNGSKLQVSFKDKTCEEVLKIFSNKAILTTIIVYDDSNMIQSNIVNFSVINEVFLNSSGEVVTAVLSIEPDQIQQKVDNVESKLLESNNMITKVETSVSDLELALCELSSKII